MAIAYKEASFEQRLHVCHVEDEHVMKRIRLVGTADSGLLGRRSLGQLEQNYLVNLMRSVRSFQDHLRKLFSFRQLRDWGCVEPISLQ